MSSFDGPPGPPTTGPDGATVAARRSVVDPGNDPAWAALMAGPEGRLFGSPPWIRAIAGTYGFDMVAEVLSTPDGPVAGMARAQVSDLRGTRVVSLPFSDYVDPVVGGDDPDDEHWRRLVGPALALGHPLQMRVLRAGGPRRDERFDVVGELMWHATDLRRPADEVVAGFNSKARQGARSARRQGVTVTFGGDLDDVRAFHDLHRQTRKRKYGLLAQPFAFFEHIWKEFSPAEGVVVGLARAGDELIAGALYLVWNDVMYYKFGASVAEHLALRPNDLLAQESVRLGVDRGLASYDWGVSDLDQPGLFGFKRKYATEESTVTVLRHRPAGHDAADGSSEGALLGDLTRLLTREDVPDDVTQRAGELLYGYFC